MMSHPDGFNITLDEIVYKFCKVAFALFRLFDFDDVYQKVISIHKELNVTIVHFVLSDSKKALAHS